MAKIDYKAYLSQVHIGEVDPKQRIKKYLEELSQKDEALKTLYRPEKIDDCYNFIRDCVKQIGTANAYCIEDAAVFKMARDYFIEILPKEADEPPEVKQAPVNNSGESEETEAETPPDEKAGVDIENSGSSNPRESETKEEPAAMPQAEQGGEPEQKAEPCGAAETASEPVHYDKHGNGLLFEF